MEGANRRPDASEPCLGCGEETAVGSAFWSDRRVVDQPGGARIHLCTLCLGRVAERHRRTRLTDEQIRNLVENGSIAAISWSRGL
jgi:hypothetical protein